MLQRGRNCLSYYYYYPLYENVTKRFGLKELNYVIRYTIVGKMASSDQYLLRFCTRLNIIEYLYLHDLCSFSDNRLCSRSLAYGFPDP